MITSHALTIDGERFVLPDLHEFKRIRARLTSAVRRGGGFVRIAAPNRDPIELLITSHSQVRMETITHDDTPEAAGATGVSTIVELAWDM